MRIYEIFNLVLYLQLRICGYFLFSSMDFLCHSILIIVFIYYNLLAAHEF